MDTKEKMNLTQKLFEIQKMRKTFAISEDSDKKDEKTGRSAYKYTPGWEIVEAVRDKMDELGVMLQQTVKDESHEFISYPVYKEYKGEIRTFEKKEMYVTLSVAFTFVDVDSGETSGPYICTGAGNNGLDKSVASAMALAERYFLLKFFHFTTRHADDEPDAHDASDIPANIPMSAMAPVPAQQGGYAPAAPAPAPYQQQERRPSPAPPSYAPQQRQGAPQPNQQPNGGDMYRRAVSELANFDSGTASFNEALNRWMTVLNQYGFNTADMSFAKQLTDASQNMRYGR